jgi:hypothetical protein
MTGRLDVRTTHLLCDAVSPNSAPPSPVSSALGGRIRACVRPRPPAARPRPMRRITLSGWSGR